MFSLLRVYLMRKKNRLLASGWGTIAVSLIALYAVGYVLMWHFGDTKVVDNYLWWFIVTVATVGYGDVYPETFGGKITAIAIIVFGIGMMTVIISKIIDGAMKMAEREITGMSAYDYSGHLIILGYRGSLTNDLVKELLADGSHTYPIVVCSDEVERNPFHLSVKDTDRVRFVRGDIASDDVLERASAPSAARVVVCGCDDGRTFLAAYAFRQVNTRAHLVASVENPDMQKRIGQLPSDDASLNQVILQRTSNLLAQEVQDPRSGRVIQDLVSNADGASLFRLDVPPGVADMRFGDIFRKFREEYGVTVLSLESDRETVPLSNPPMDAAVRSGMALFYVANGDAKLRHVDWAGVK